MVEGRMQKAIAVLNLLGLDARYAVDALKDALQSLPSPHIEPWLALARAGLAKWNTLAVLTALRHVQGQLEDVPVCANDWFKLAAVDAQQGREEEAARYAE